MKEKTAFKSIFLKTAITFFTFYFIVAIVFTATYYKILINGNKVKIDNMLNVLEANIHDEISRIGTDNPKEKENLTELNAYISYLTSNYSKEMFAKSYLYDENYNMIAKSRNLLRVSNMESINTSHSLTERYIDLDRSLSEDQKIELFKLYNQHVNSQAYFIKGQGYVNGDEIIPEEIEIYKNAINDPVSVAEGMKSAEKIKTFKLNVQEVDGLRKIGFNDYLDSCWEIHYNDGIYNSENSNELYKNIFERYENFNEYSKEEIKSIIAEKRYGQKIDFSKPFWKVNYDYIETLTYNNHNYYLILKTDYYPWEDIIPKAIPLYLVSLIIVLAMVIILSKGLYKTYEKQAVLEKNRRELTSAIAHELKTPLGIIRTYGEGLKEKIAEDKRDYYLDVIIDETYKMDKIVLEMLDLSKMEAKAYELKKEEFCINSLVEVILKKNEKLFNDSNLNIKYLTDKEYYINADYALIERVINNLLSNAIYHTEENKSINITLKNQIFNIENEGEHIPEDKINLIWDTFYRGDSSRDRSERRTGVGLAIVKNILELHNMEFGVDNTTVGVKFWFKF